MSIELPKPVGRIFSDGFSFMSEEVYRCWRDPGLNPRGSQELEPVFTAEQVAALLERVERGEWLGDYLTTASIEFRGAYCKPVTGGTDE